MKKKVEIKGNKIKYEMPVPEPPKMPVIFTVRYRDLSWPLKTLVVLGWITVAIFVVDLITYIALYGGV